MKFWVSAAVIALLAALVLVWKITDAAARRQEARAGVLEARAAVIHARKEGRLQGWRRASTAPPPSDLAEADEADLAALPAAPATTGDDPMTLETLGTWTALAGLAMLAALLAAWAWPKLIKPTLEAKSPTAAAAVDKLVSYADEAAAATAIASLALICKTRGDAEGIALCGQLWTRAMTWPRETTTAAEETGAP